MNFSPKAIAGAIVGAIDRRIEAKLRQTAAVVVPLAQSYAPVRTGYLRSSIHADVSNRTMTLRVDAPYGIFVNSGTRHMMGSFFIERALSEAGRIVWGGALRVDFPSTPHVRRPIYSHRGGYLLPGNLTRGQRRHVAEHLLPASRGYHAHPNVRRARLTVGHVS